MQDDSDGHPVEVPVTPRQSNRVGTEFDLKVGRPAGLEHGGMIDAAMAFNVGPLPLAPGRYQWRLELGDQLNMGWIDRYHR